MTNNFEDGTNAIVIAWTGPGGRSTALADGLGAQIYNIEAGMKRRRWNSPLRYAIQAAHTVRAMRTAKAGLVVVQNPPIVTAMIVHLVQKVTGTGELVIDSHTGAFLDPRWSRFLFIHRWLSRRAKWTLVHNSAQGRLVDTWDVPWLQVSYVKSARLQRPNGVVPPSEVASPVVLAICSGGYDEPIDAIAEAAAAMPDVLFEVTGRSERVRARLGGSPPSNMVLLDFLPFDDYLDHVRTSTVVLALTTRPDTLLSGGLEAIAIGKPLVTSETAVLREYFSRGTIHTSNDGPSIKAGLLEALETAEDMAKEMIAYSIECDAEWSEIKNVLTAPTIGSGSAERAFRA